MAYSDDILTLSPDHLWTFENVLTDTNVLNAATNVSCTFQTTPICRDATYSLQTAVNTAVLTFPVLATTYGSSIGVWGMWFRATAIQGPPCLIVSAGGTTAGFAIFLWASNNVMAQFWDTGVLKQIYGNLSLTNNRAYHFGIRWEDSSGLDKAEFLIDGIAQSAEYPAAGFHGGTLTNWSGAMQIGSQAVDTIPVGNGVCLLRATVSAQYSNMMYKRSAISSLDFYNTVFGRGAIPEYTITSGTQPAMQLQIDALASTVCGDNSLGILVEAVTGDGNLTLTSDNITFLDRCGSHVRYDGSGILTWINTNGGSASLVHGSVVVSNPATLTIEGLIAGSIFQIYDNEIANYENDDTLLYGTESCGTSYAFSHDGSVNDIVVKMMNLDYIEIRQVIPLGSADSLITLLPQEEIY